MRYLLRIRYQPGQEFGFYLYNLNNCSAAQFLTSDVKVPIPKNARPATFGPHSLHARTVLKGGYTAHHRVFDGETFSYNWGTSLRVRRLLLLVSRTGTCWDYRHPLILSIPHASSSAVGLFAVAMASALAFVVVSKGARNRSERSRHPPPKRRGTGRSTSDLLLCVVLRLFYFQIGYAENSRNVHNNLLSIRLSLLLALFFLLHPHPSLNAREEILPYYCLVKFNTSFGLIFGTQTPT